MSQQVVTLLLGSNLGDRKKNIETALEKIQKLAGELLKKSKLIDTKPVEFVSSNIFCNIAVSINTHFSPYKLLKIIKEIEREMGRERDSGDSGVYENRIIDIDIVTFGNLNFYCKKLKIPHRRHLFDRSFSRDLLTQLK